MATATKSEGRYETRSIERATFKEEREESVYVPSSVE